MAAGSKKAVTPSAAPFDPSRTTPRRQQAAPCSRRPARGGPCGPKRRPRRPLERPRKRRSTPSPDGDARAPRQKHQNRGGGRRADARDGAACRRPGPSTPSPATTCEHHAAAGAPRRRPARPATIKKTEEVQIPRTTPKAVAAPILRPRLPRGRAGDERRAAATRAAGAAGPPRPAPRLSSLDAALLDFDPRRRRGPGPRGAAAPAPAAARPPPRARAGAGAGRRRGGRRRGREVACLEAERAAQGGGGAAPPAPPARPPPPARARAGVDGAAPARPLRRRWRPSPPPRRRPRRRRRPPRRRPRRRRTSTTAASTASATTMRRRSRRRLSIGPSCRTTNSAEAAPVPFDLATQNVPAPPSERVEGKPVDETKLARGWSGTPPCGPATTPRPAQDATWTRPCRPGPSRAARADPQGPGGRRARA